MIVFSMAASPRLAPRSIVCRSRYCNFGIACTQARRRERWPGIAKSPRLPRAWLPRDAVFDIEAVQPGLPLAQNARVVTADRRTINRRIVVRSCVRMLRRVAIIQSFGEMLHRV